MGHLRNVGQVVSVGGALSLLSPLPIGAGLLHSQHEPAMWKRRSAATLLHSAQLAALPIHAPSLPLTVFDEPVTAAPDSRSGRYARLASLWERIEKFARMPDGWAGDGTVPPNRKVTAHVGLLLSELPEDLELPQATASGEGEIGLTWFRGDNRLDAIASSDCYLAWASKVGDEFLEGDVVMLSSKVFDPLYEALVTFYG